MSTPFRVLGVLLVLVMLAGCGDSDPVGPEPIGPPEEMPALVIEGVSYVNKQVHNSHLDAVTTAGYSRTVDLTIDFGDEVTMGQIGRILLYGRTPAANLGWEIGREELAGLAMENGAVLRIPNLVYLADYYSTASDVFFELVVEGLGAEGVAYEFIHKNRFPLAFNTQPAWYDRERLSVAFNYDCCGPTSGLSEAQAIWLDEDVELGTSEAPPEAGLSPTVFLFDDVPATASSFYTVVEGNIEGIETEIVTGITPLPTRVPPNTAFVNGIDVTGSLTSESSSADVFVLRDYQTNELHVVRPDASMAGPFELSSDPTAVYATAETAFVGYGSGRLDAWDLATGERRRLGTYDLEIRALGYAEGYVLAMGRADSYDRKIYAIDAISGVVANEDDYFPYYDTPIGLVFNERNGRVYGSFGSQLMSASFNAATGTFADFRARGSNNSAYPEPPLHLFPDGRALVSAQGGIYTTSSNESEDMEYVERFEFSTRDVGFLPDTDRMLAVRGNYSGDVLDLYALSTREHLRDLTVPGRPMQIVSDGDRVHVLSMSESYQLPRVMVTTFDDGDLTVNRRQRMAHVVARPVSR
ncbi:MAG: hypothetical protein ABJF88_04285 [Rhodothermales bacterium]